MKYDFSNLRQKGDVVKTKFKNEIASLRAGRANPIVLENVVVDAYGSKMPLTHVATISVEDARTLRVTPWDTAMLKSIEIAIGNSNVGGQPIADGNSIRVTLPALTEERRKTLLKFLSEKLEEGRISMRMGREEVWRDIQEKEKIGEIPEDDKFRLKDEMQKIVDKISEELEMEAGRKENEIKKS